MKLSLQFIVSWTTRLTCIKETANISLHWVLVTSDPKKSFFLESRKPSRNPKPRTEVTAESSLDPNHERACEAHEKDSHQTKATY